MAGEVVPFGKYKGQPVEAMAQDRQYIDWLTAQPWFKERFGNIYTLIVNNFQEPSETPEHNALQAKFLDPAFRLVFMKYLVPTYSAGFDSLTVEFERDGFDVFLHGSIRKVNEGYSQGYPFFIECKPSVGDDYPAVLRQIKTAKNAPEVMLGAGRQFYREMSRDSILFLCEYVGVGATRDQFIAFFKASGVEVIFAADIEKKLNAAPGLIQIEDFFKESP